MKCKTCEHWKTMRGIDGWGRCKISENLYKNERSRPRNGKKPIAICSWGTYAVLETNCEFGCVLHEDKKAKRSKKKVVK